MRSSLVCFVRPRRPIRDTPQLYPPLKLFREILRAHRVLPGPQRALGDAYVRAEFKAHKDTENPLHIIGFLTEWQGYLGVIKGGNWLEHRLKKEDLDKMSPDQIGQVSIFLKKTI
ncbi:hypothetical protein PACTADRAFT_51353 [Pachysolen tannophilus NRRL Y-2460]|uniref:Succinate dehydrogenase assembly factor 3 n=1 Tax=Pachysolen tannophilus NRRL Y-2460 TaxID=669874 RepID=A0A1E4TP74_PACTA|nr:hypothetical protein PACTADRAFT_51353 [Pachysolen tannophilus NRRL Y-2460]